MQKAINTLTDAVKSGNGNLLKLSIEAARKRATLGEISMAIEKVSGRHKATIRSISGVYSNVYKDSSKIEEIKKMTDEFYELEGRRPRLLMAKIGQDGHDRGAKVISTAFSDLGFDVDIGPLFQTPEEVAKQAVENDVHVIGMSSLAGGHKTFLPQLKEELKKFNREDMIIIVGGVIPPKDYQYLIEMGAAAVFGPGTIIPNAAKTVLEKIYKQLGYEDVN